jgi:hypothetical protein
VNPSLLLEWLYTGLCVFSLSSPWRVRRSLLCYAPPPLPLIPKFPRARVSLYHRL